MMAEFTNTKESGLETLIVNYLTEHNVPRHIAIGVTCKLM